MGRVINAHEKNSRRATLQAENALHTGNAPKALELLQGVELLPGSHARTVAIQAALKAENWEFIAATISEPQSTEEAVFLISALIRIGSLEQADAVLIKQADIDGATRSELEGQLEMKRIMRSE